MSFISFFLFILFATSIFPSYFITLRIGIRMCLLFLLVYPLRLYLFLPKFLFSRLPQLISSTLFNFAFFSMYRQLKLVV